MSRSPRRSRKSRKRRRSRSRRRRRRSSSTTGSSSSLERLTRSTLGSAQRLAKERPGHLLLATIKNVIPFLDHRQKAEVLRTGGIYPVFVSYYHQVVAGKPLGRRTLREFLTLATALDQLIMGNVPEVGDLLVQRLKALESASADNNWEIAQNMEILQQENPSLTSRSERSLVTKETLQHQSEGRKISQATFAKGKGKAPPRSYSRAGRHSRPSSGWDHQSEERDARVEERDQESPQPENRELPPRLPALRSPQRQNPKGKGKGKQKSKHRRGVTWER